MTTLSDLIGADTQPWMSNGICATAAFPGDWFPTDSYELPSVAANLCAGCPVQTACLSYAMTYRTDNKGALEGIWGGTTTSQRAELRKGEKCGTVNGYAKHRRDKEPACRPCKDAKAAYVREREAA